MTPANASADSPPLNMVPGHKAGENKNAELAVRRHPSPKPVFAELRRVPGCAKRYAAVAVATESVLKMSDVGKMDNDLACKIDARMVTKESKTPARRVKLTSPVEQVKDETAQVIDWEEGFPLDAGSGGLRKTTVLIRAR